MASWDLSPLYRHSSSLLLPDSTRVVSFHNGRVVLRNLDSLQIIRTWALSTPSPSSATSASSPRAAPSLPPLTELTSFAVSPSKPYHVICYAAKVKTAWVLDPEKDEVVARLEVGNEGAVRMDWAQVPARDEEEGEAVVIAWSANHLRLSLFRLTSSSSPALHIQSPKHSHAFGHSFHPTLPLFALFERHNSRDVLSIYSTTGEWALVRSLTLPNPASDLAGLSWSPCGRYISAWSSVTEYIVHFFSPTLTLLSTFSPYASLSPSPSLDPAPSSSSSSRPKPLLRKASSSSTPAPPPPPAEKDLSEADRNRAERSTKDYVGLGVRTVEWHPSGEFVAVGGFDGRIRILSRHAFSSPLAELSLPVRLSSPVRIWREPSGWVEKTRGRGIVSFERITTLPYTLTPVVANPAVPNPKMGFSRVAWAPGERGEWLVGLNQFHPNALSIFSFPTSSFLAPSSSSPFASSPSPSSSSCPTSKRPHLHTVLLFSSPVKDFAWQPRLREGERETLVMVNGAKAFTVWKAPGGDGRGGGEAEGVGVPAGQTPLSLSSLSFSARGDSLLLSSSAPEPSGTGGNSAKKAGETAGGGGAEETGGLFCVAYPVLEEGDGGAEEGRTWIEEDGEGL
ncbi:hypothetical protein JCM8547_009192 [Rhodosporidiobolus lusitaniae]